MYAKQLELYLMNSVEQQQKKTGSTTAEKQENLRYYKRIPKYKKQMDWA